MHKSLKIPDSKKVQGLKLWCSACRHEIGTNNFCAEINATSAKCPNAKDHAFRVVVYEPKGHKRKVKVLKTKNIDEAIRQAVQFREEVKAQKPKIDEPENEIATPPVSRQEASPAPALSFMQGASYYLAYLWGKRGHEHARGERKRSPKHVKDIEKAIVLFGQALKKNEVDPEKAEVKNIPQEYISIYHNFLLKDKKYGNRTYNRYMANMRAMFNYLNKHEGFEIKNPFNPVQRRKAVTDIKTIEPEEFKKLLDVITPQAGEQILANGEKKNRYYPFLKEAFKLGLLTGLRREQLVELRFNNIQENEQNIPIVVTSNNLKVNRIMGNEETGNARITPTPVTPQLRELLMQMGYAKHKHSDRYLIAPDSHLQRSTIMNILSKSFAFYWKKLGNPKNLDFKHLRKSFCTRLQIALGDNAKLVTGHSNQQTLNSHYINRTEIALAVNNRNIFPELDFSDNEKMKELEQVRKEQKHKDISLER